MALLELQPTRDGTPNYDMRTKLDGNEYSFRFRFGERRGGWVFDLYTVGDEVQIVSGQLVIIGQDLLRRSSVIQKPPGRLFAFCLEGTRELPQLFELGPGGRVRLYYQEAAEE